MRGCVDSKLNCPPDGRGDVLAHVKPGVGRAVTMYCTAAHHDQFFVMVRIKICRRTFHKYKYNSNLTCPPGCAERARARGGRPGT